MSGRNRVGRLKYTGIDGSLGSSETFMHSNATVLSTRLMGGVSSSERRESWAKPAGSTSNGFQALPYLVYY